MMSMSAEAGIESPKHTQRASIFAYWCIYYASTMVMTPSLAHITQNPGHIFGTFLNHFGLAKRHITSLIVICLNVFSECHRHIFPEELAVNLYTFGLNFILN